MKHLILILAVFFIGLCSCHHATKDVLLQNAEGKVLSHGAIYISCESPSWQFDFDGLLACVQEMPVDTSTLNPEFTCPMSSIQQENGQLELNFSDDYNRGRMIIKSKDSSIELRENMDVVVSELYLNDSIYFYLIRNHQTLRVNVKNLYVGGCFHELIRWQEMSF